MNYVWKRVLIFSTGNKRKTVISKPTDTISENNEFFFTILNDVNLISSSSTQTVSLNISMSCCINKSKFTCIRSCGGGMIDGIANVSLTWRHDRKTSSSSTNTTWRRQVRRDFGGQRISANRSRSTIYIFQKAN